MCVCTNDRKKVVNDIINIFTSEETATNTPRI